VLALIALVFGMLGALIPICGAITFLITLQPAVRQPDPAVRRPRRWTVVLLMLGLLRIGEASNPGPEANFDDSLFHIGTFNPSGLRGKAQYVHAHLSQGDLWTISETHFFGRDLQSFRAGLKAANSKFKYCFSDSCSLKPRMLTQTSWKGVAVAASVPTRPIPAQVPDVVTDSGRCLLFTSLIRDA
jgi:hypothetical protein